jgi:hypothetical protein
MRVLNRNIAGSARLVSYGTGPPGYIGWDYEAWRAGTKSANLAQPCLKLRLLDISLFFLILFGIRDPLRNMKASLSPFGRAPHLQVPCSYLQIYYILARTFKKKWKKLVNGSGE